MRKLGPREKEWQPQSHRVELGPPIAGSTRPSSTWFRAGVPCKVVVSLFWGPAHFLLLKYDFSKCFANLFTVSSFLQGFPCRGCWVQKDNQGREGRLCLRGTVFFWLPSWTLYSEKSYFLLSYDFYKSCNKYTKIMSLSLISLTRLIDWKKMKLGVSEHPGHMVPSGRGTLAVTSRACGSGLVLPRPTLASLGFSSQKWVGEPQLPIIVPEVRTVLFPLLPCPCSCWLVRDVLVL